MYREQAPEPALRELVHCTWEHQGTGPVWIVPDACVDVIWDGRQLLVAGPDTRAVNEHVAGKVHGVRLRTGRAGAVLGVPASSLLDARVPLAELWEVERWLEALQREPPARVLQRMVRLRQPADALVEALVSRLHAQPAQRVAALARELGASERQLNRRCVEAVGYGPKMLGRVLRMQNITRALRRGSRGRSLAALALEHGFSDQAHFGHEAAALYGRTPATLRLGVENV